jgi:hypothetical protein
MNDERLVEFVEELMKNPEFLLSHKEAGKLTYLIIGALRDIMETSVEQTTAKLMLEITREGKDGQRTD